MMTDRLCSADPDRSASLNTTRAQPNARASAVRWPGVGEADHVHMLVGAPEPAPALLARVTPVVRVVLHQIRRRRAHSGLRQYIEQLNRPV